MPASITVAGVPLDSFAYKVATRSGWRANPGVRSTSITASNVDGVIVPSRRAPLEPGAIGLSLWVRGRNYAEFTEHVDTLMSLFTVQDETFEVRLLTDAEYGIERICQARPSTQWVVEHLSPLHATFNVVLEIPSGTWTSTRYYVNTARPHYTSAPMALECGDPSISPTDIKILLRDPLDALDFTFHDGNATIEEYDRENVSLSLPSAIPSTSSLLLDFGSWHAYEVPRPSPSEVTADYFELKPNILTDYSADLRRRGPMFGTALMPLRVGAALPPRTPRLWMSIVPDDTVPYGIVPDVSVALRPRWI